MHSLRLVMLLVGALLVIVLPLFDGEAAANPLAIGSIQELQPAVQSRVAMVQTLTCTSPNCGAQCRGRGYRRGSCQIGRCFCSYV